MKNGNFLSTTGEELKELMLKNNELPEEYINEANLNALLEHEYKQLDADEHYNTEIISYCSKLLAERYAPENYVQIKAETLAKIKASINSSENGERFSEVDIPEIKKNVKHDNDDDGKGKKPGIRKTFMLVAAIGFVISLFSVFSHNNNLWDDGFNFSQNMFASLVAGEVMAQEETARLGSGRVVYNSVEEFEAEQNIKILVPTWLPDDLKVESVNYEESEQVRLLYNSGETTLFIRFNSSIPNTEDTKIYKNNNGLTFFVSNGLNVIVWEYEGNIYNLTCDFNVLEHADEIIKNIK